MSIPTIRLDDPDRSNAVQTLRSACMNVGFFYLEGHGIPLRFLDEVFEQSRELFNLPLEEKIKLSDKTMSRGYTAFEEETLDPAKQRERGDTKEGYYIGRDVPESSPEYNPAKLSGPNVWPTNDNCSMEDCTKFKQVMMKYHREASEVGFRLVQLLASAIGLDDEHCFDNDFDEGLASIRLLHYAAERSRPDDGVFACGAHSDYGMITLLLTDSNPGLQIFTKNGRWIDVPPKRGAYIVNLGDMLERWTNGLFKSTLHRVLTSGENERYSIPFFFEPNFDTRVEVLGVCCDGDNPPKYPPTTSGQHLLDKYLQTHADFEPDKS